MSIKSELQEILEPYRNGGDYEDFEMLTQAILDLLDKSLQEAYELGFNDASRKYNSSHDARIEKIPPHLRDEFEADVRKVIKEG